MKITTWNVNSLTARLQHVLDWTAANPVDVLCLQELKLTDDRFPLDGLARGRLRALRRVRPEDLQRRGDHEPQAVARRGEEHRRLCRRAFTRDRGDRRRPARRAAAGQRLLRQRAGARHREVRLQDELAARSERDYLREELPRHPRLVLVGDFNIAPEDRDSWDPEGLRDTIHHTTRGARPFPRAARSWACATASGCSSSRRRASAGGTTACSATRRTAACASTTSW